MKDNQKSKLIFRIVDEVFATFSLGFVLFLIIVTAFDGHRYMHVLNWGNLFLAYSLPLLIILGYVLRLVFRKNENLKGSGLVLALGTLLLVPLICAMGISFIWCDSYTTDIKNYRQYDRKVNDGGLFPDVLPERSDLKEETDYKYHYNFITHIDPSWNIYAEWTLEQDAFDKEVERMKALFASWSEKNSDHIRYTTVQRGGWTCLFEYYKDDPVFEAVGDDCNTYCYRVFAYHEATGQVRYIYDYCMDVVDEQPYYLSLEWE